MYIEARLNNMHIRTSCVTCGASDKPGDVAYYDENNNWVCDTCVESGVEAMRANLHAEAERYRRLAGQYEETAEEEITIAPIRGEVLRERDQLDAWAAREKIRQQNAPDVDFGDVPF